MQQNKIQTIAAATNAAELIIGGISELGAGVSLPHNPATDINTELTNLIMACGDHEQSKQVKATRRNALVDKINEAKSFIRVVRDFLKLTFGNSYSDLWTVLGFQDSLEMPDKIEDVKRMLQAIKLYLANNPDKEVGAIITAARAQALMEALLAAQQAIVAQDVTIGLLMEARDAKFETLKKRIGSVYQELRMQFGPLDQRWGNFGFNMPGADETPEMPTGLVATLIGPTAVALKWEAAERAAYYRIYKKVTGVDEVFVAVGSPADLDFTIEGLPAGATVEIQITAVNTGGESSRTEAVTVVMHS